MLINVGDYVRELKPGVSPAKRGVVYALALIPATVFMGVIGLMVTQVTGIANPVVGFAKIVPNKAVVLFTFIFIIFAQITTNLLNNALPPIYVMMDACKISFKKSAVIVGLLAYATFPWELIKESSAAGLNLFILIYSAFLGPIFAVLIVDYYVIRKEKASIKDYYDPNGPFKGIHLPAIGAVIVGVIFSFIAIGGSLCGGEEIDAQGMYVLPGVVDAHVHLCEPGRTEWEGFETGTRALAKGGTTCYVDIPLNNLPATIDGETIKVKLEAAKDKNYVDYALYGGLVPHNLGKLHELHEAGVTAYKCFVSTCGFGVTGDFKDVNDYALYKGMLELKELGQTLSIHCENALVCDLLAEEAKKNGKIDMDAYMDSRPIFAEVEAVRRVLYFGKVTGCKLHFVHLSCAEAVQEVIKGKNDGMDVTIESCPHYLNLSREICVEELGSIGKCSPPVRCKAETEKLWEEVVKGHVDILTSDHSPCPPVYEA